MDATSDEGGFGPISRTPIPQPKVPPFISLEMSLNYVKDPAAQALNFPASNCDDGAESVIRYYQRGTDEVKNLLKNECSLIFECSCCRTLFRSIINFVAHKRTVCRTLLSSIRAEQTELARESQKASQKGNSERDSADSANNSQRKIAKANRNLNLRRFNPTSNLVRHIRAVNVHLERTNTDVEVQTLPKVVRKPAETSFIDGKQVVEHLPTELSTIKESVPENRVALVMPRECSVRCGEMQLRRRRGTQMAKARPNEGKVCELTSEEIEIIERIPSAMPVDFTTNHCEDQRCLRRGLLPFGSLNSLAHHLAIQHQMDFSEEGMIKQSAKKAFIKCFLCDVTPFHCLADLQKHFNAAHSIVRQHHNRFRVEQSNADNNVKRKAPSPTEFRSLSPISLPKDKDEDGGGEGAIGEGDREAEESAELKRPTRKPFRRPILFTPISKEEEQKQHFEAALALRDWVRNKLIVRKAANSKNDEELEEEEEEEEDDVDEVPPLRNVVTDAEDGRCFFDEEEARKIDRLLNSRTNAKDKLVEEEFSDDATDRRTPGMNEGEDSKKDEVSLTGRERRSRKPNKKFLEVPIEENDKQTTDTAKKSRPVGINTPCSSSSTTVSSKESLSKPKTLLIAAPLKRKSAKNLSKHRKKAKVSYSQCKPMELAQTKDDGCSADGTNAEKGRPGCTSSTAPMADGSIPMEDFVLPAQIKETVPMTDAAGAPLLVSETDGEGTPVTEESKNDATSEGSGADDAEGKRSSAPPQLTKECLPTMVTGRYREDLIFYTPKARAKIREKEFQRHSSSTSSGSSRRKQIFSSLEQTETDGIALVSSSGSNDKEQSKAASSDKSEPPPPKPKDLGQVPVYLTEHQRDLFFKPLKPLFNINTVDDGFWQCGECGEVLKNIRDGRRHMVSHIRVMRMRCSLCDAGAFFCSDMRVHLMYRHCDKLNLAPDEFINTGTPCMSREKADLLTQLVDPYHPGRVMYTTGKIVSWSNPKAYFPDPKSERNILGPALPGY